MSVFCLDVRFANFTLDTNQSCGQVFHLKINRSNFDFSRLRHYEDFLMADKMVFTSTFQLCVCVFISLRELSVSGFAFIRPRVFQTFRMIYVFCFFFLFSYNWNGDVFYWFLIDRVCESVIQLSLSRQSGFCFGFEKIVIDSRRSNSPRRSLKSRSQTAFFVFSIKNCMYPLPRPLEILRTLKYVCVHEVGIFFAPTALDCLHKRQWGNSWNATRHFFFTLDLREKKKRIIPSMQPTVSKNDNFMLVTTEINFNCEILKLFSGTCNSSVDRAFGWWTIGFGFNIHAWLHFFLLLVENGKNWILSVKKIPITIDEKVFIVVDLNSRAPLKTERSVDCWRSLVQNSNVTHQWEK